MATRPKQWPAHAESARRDVIDLASGSIRTLDEATAVLRLANDMIDSNNRPTARVLLANAMAFIASVEASQSHIWRLMVEAKHPERSE